MRKVTLASMLAVGALAVTAGTASTASNTLPSSVAGYGTSTVSGATATSLNYTLNGDGSQITAADLVFTGNQTGKTIKAGFGTDALQSCTVGAHDAVANTTPVSCTPYTQSTSTATSFNVAVS